MKKEHSKLRVAKKELKGAKSELEAMRNALDREETVNNALKVCTGCLKKVHRFGCFQHREMILASNLINGSQNVP